MSMSAQLPTAVLPFLVWRLPVCAIHRGIQGSVFDPTGAAIPNALVTIHSPANGIDRVLNTDTAGYYFVPSLVVGTYRVDVKAPGHGADGGIECRRICGHNHPTGLHHEGGICF